MHSDETTIGASVSGVTRLVSVRLACCIAAWTAIQLWLQQAYPGAVEVWQSVFVFQVQRPYYVWTWVTSIFSHLDPTHAAVNIFALLGIGYPLERRLATKQYLLVFFGSAFAGILGFYAVASGMDYYVVGVSGAIAGLFGYVTVDLATEGRNSPLPRADPVLLASLFFAVYSAYLIFTGGAVANGVANSAHLGGWAFGTLAALYMNFERYLVEIAVGPK